MRHPRSKPSLAPASLAILRALADGTQHTYGIMQQIARLGLGHGAPIGPATLCRAIKQLLEERMIDEVNGPPVNGEARRYYRCTDLGRRQAQLATPQP